MNDFLEFFKNYFSEFTEGHMTLVFGFTGLISSVLGIIFYIKKLSKINSTIFNPENVEKNNNLKNEFSFRKIKLHKILFWNLILFWLNLFNLLLFLIPSSKINLNKWIQKTQNKINLLKKK